MKLSRLRFPRRRPAVICDDVAAWAAKQGAQAVELLAPRTVHRAPPNTVELEIDGEYTTRFVGKQRGRYLVKVRDPRIVGAFGLVVLPDGAYAAESLYSRAMIEAHPDYLHPPRRTVVRKSGCFFSLLGGWAVEGNYYHWLHDTLTRLFGVAAHLPADTRFVVPAVMSEFQRESLRMLGLRDEQLVLFDGSEEWLVEELYFAPPTSNSGSSRDEAIQWLRSELVGAAGQADRAPTRRILLSRQAAKTRRLTNYAEAESLLARHGFEGCAPEALGFREEVALFAEAAVIVGQHGAGLANMLFAPPGAKILDIIPRPVPSAAYVYWTMAQALGHEYWYLVADSVDAGGASQPDMCVPLDKLSATLDRML